MTPTMTGERFIVTELSGFFGPRKGGGRNGPGLSCHVIDTAFNHRVMATFRTESQTGRSNIPHTAAQREAIVRKQARERADLLNAGLAVECQLQLLSGGVAA